MSGCVSLTSSDIGIITPYRKQVEKIRLLLGRTGIEDIKVRTVFYVHKVCVCGFLCFRDLDHFYLYDSWTIYIVNGLKGKTLCLELVPSHDCSLSFKRRVTHVHVFFSIIR